MQVNVVQVKIGTCQAALNKVKLIGQKPLHKCEDT